VNWGAETAEAWSGLQSGIDKGGVVLVYVDLRVVLAAPAELRLLSDLERTRADRIRSREARNSFIAGRAVVRTVLGALTHQHGHSVQLSTWCTHCRSSDGRPRLLDPRAEVEFSISHSWPHLVVAFSTLRVGCDVEPTSRPAALANGVGFALSDRERAALAKVTPARRPAQALALWTRKEAVLKVIGHGLRVAPASIDTGHRGAQHQPQVERLPKEFGAPGCWSLLSLCAPGLVGAVAADRPVRDVSAWWCSTGPDPSHPRLVGHALQPTSGRFSGTRGQKQSGEPVMVLRGTAGTRALSRAYLIPSRSET
jgi:phosphopantetheinyl transferase